VGIYHPMWDPGGAWVGDESACKPASVSAMRRVTIHLRPPLPVTWCGLPAECERAALPPGSVARSA